MRNSASHRPVCAPPASKPINSNRSVMEAAAAAQVCLRNGVKFAALKSVSDHLFSDNQAEEYFDFGHALEELGKIVLPFALALQKEEL